MAWKHRAWFACLHLGVIASVALAGCKPSFSPDTYNAAAVQQANKVDQGVVVGVRQVGVQVAGTTGAVAGAGVGGIAGSQLPGSNTTAAIGAVGGSLIGGLFGAGVERATGDTAAYEYIVRKPNGELVSVTQTDKVPMALGQRVLVIAGSQARIVPDYTTALPEAPKDAAKDAKPKDPVQPPDAPAKEPPKDAAATPAAISTTPLPPPKADVPQPMSPTARPPSGAETPQEATVPAPP